MTHIVYFNYQRSMSVQTLNKSKEVHGPWIVSATADVSTHQRCAQDWIFH